MNDRFNEIIYVTQKNVIIKSIETFQIPEFNVKINDSFISFKIMVIMILILGLKIYKYFLEWKVKKRSALLSTAATLEVFLSVQLSYNKKSRQSFSPSFAKKKNINQPKN